MCNGSTEEEEKKQKNIFEEIVTQKINEKFMNTHEAQ